MKIYVDVNSDKVKEIVGDNEGPNNKLHLDKKTFIMNDLPEDLGEVVKNYVDSKFRPLI